MAIEHVRTYELPLHDLCIMAPDIAWRNAPVISPDLSPVQVCQMIGEWYVIQTSLTRRHAAGQYFTPPLVARYMAYLAGMLSNELHILDPGAGTGMLVSALCEAAFKQEISALSIVAYELDPVLCALCSFTLTYARNWLQERGITLTFEVRQQDFVQAMAEQLTQTTLWSNMPQPSHPFDLAVLNPPYFKVNQKDARAQSVKELVHGRTNMYTMFMSLAASSLRVGGRFISITPRSFASGVYFKQFRHQFFNMIAPDLIHLFDSRKSTFEEADVLQENIILAGTRKGIASVDAPTITISQSRGLDDLAHPLTQQMRRNLIIDQKQKDPILHLPTSDLDTHLLQTFRSWKNTLASYGLEISTGPVVPFRSTDMLASVEQAQRGEAVPLLWLQHVHRMDIQWPLQDFDKPQGILRQADHKLLVKNATQVVIRRFSAKEELRRITAAVLPEGSFGSEYIGLENHLNYLYRLNGVLSYEEAVGLAAFLNSSLVDRYVRIANGNTQINATELRKLPLPDWSQLVAIGNQVASQRLEHDFDATERIIMDVLKKDLILGDEEHDLQLPGERNCC